MKLLLVPWYRLQCLNEISIKDVVMIRSVNYRNINWRTASYGLKSDKKVFQIQLQNVWRW